MNLNSLLNDFHPTLERAVPTFSYWERVQELFLVKGLVSRPLHELAGDDEKDEAKVRSLMASGQWDTNPEHFFRSFSMSKHPKMLTQYDVDDFRDMKCFKVPGYNIGFALKPFSGGGQGDEIVAVHNNDPRVRGIGKDLVRAFVQEGGRYLDHFDGKLSDLYGDEFQEYLRYPYDPQYDQDGTFAAQYGKPDVVFRHHRSVPAPE